MAQLSSFHAKSAMIILNYDTYYVEKYRKIVDFLLYFK